MRVKVLIAAQLLGLSLLLINAPLTEAEIKPGVRAGAYFDAESGFIGGEILASFSEQWFFNPNVEYVFVDRASLWTINFDFHYDLVTDTPFYFWFGAGPAVILFDPDAPRLDDDTDFGVNLFGGIGFPLPDSRIVPYVQPKFILSDNSEFAVAFGVRF